MVTDMVVWHSVLPLSPVIGLSACGTRALATLCGSRSRSRIYSSPAWVGHAVGLGHLSGSHQPLKSQAYVNPEWMAGWRGRQVDGETRQGGGGPVSELSSAQWLPLASSQGAVGRSLGKAHIHAGPAPHLVWGTALVTAHDI